MPDSHPVLASHAPLQSTATVSRRTYLQRLTGWAAGCVGSIGMHPGSAWAQSPTDLWQQPRVIVLRGSADQPAAHGEFEYWRDGQYQMETYLALSRLCLDRHTGAAVQMDPRVFDLMYATQRWYQQVTGRRAEHQISSAYRTVRTNTQVGGAPGSQHLFGRALDGRLLGVDLATYARMLQAFQAGGVGLYSRHVHWDVGRSARFWAGAAVE